MGVVGWGVGVSREVGMDGWDRDPFCYRLKQKAPVFLSYKCLAWGECEVAGWRTERWTIEQFATGGGAPCELRDGTSRRVPC